MIRRDDPTGTMFSAVTMTVSAAIAITGLKLRAVLADAFARYAGVVGDDVEIGFALLPHKSGVQALRRP